MKNLNLNRKSSGWRKKREREREKEYCECKSKEIKCAEKHAIQFTCDWPLTCLYISYTLLCGEIFVCGMGDFPCIWQREQSLCFFKWNELSVSTLAIYSSACIVATLLQSARNNINIITIMTENQNSFFFLKLNKNSYCRSRSRKFVLNFQMNEWSHLWSPMNVFYRKSTNKRKIRKIIPIAFVRVLKKQQ